VRVDRRGGAASDPGRSVLRHATDQTRIRPTRGTPPRPRPVRRIPRGSPNHATRTEPAGRPLTAPSPGCGAAPVPAATPAETGCRAASAPWRFAPAVRVGLPLNRSPSKASTALGVPPEVCTRMSARLQRLSTVPLYELDAVMCTDPGGQQVVARRARRNWRPGTRRPTSSSAGTAPTRPATPAGTAGSIAGPRPALVST